MSKTDRVRVYYNLHKKCFSIQDYKTGLVTKHTNQLFLTNALFVVRKSGNERVKSEGKKNVHAFVNGIESKLKANVMPCFASCEVKYNPYEMDYFHYKRMVTDWQGAKPVWLPVDKHWIGNVSLNIVNGKPVMYADIDKLSATSSTKKLSTHSHADEKEFGVTELLNTQFFKSSVVGGKFLRKKRKIIDSRNKIKNKTIVI